MEEQGMAAGIPQRQALASSGQGKRRSYTFGERMSTAPDMAFAAIMVLGLFSRQANASSTSLMEKSVQQMTNLCPKQSRPPARGATVGMAVSRQSRLISFYHSRKRYGRG